MLVFTKFNKKIQSFIPLEEDVWCLAKDLIFFVLYIYIYTYIYVLPWFCCVYYREQWVSICVGWQCMHLLFFLLVLFPLSYVLYFMNNNTLILIKSWCFEFDIWSHLFYGSGDWFMYLKSSILWLIRSTCVHRTWNI